MTSDAASLRPTFRVSPVDRIALMGHLPCSVWMTGLSGSGKSTLADAVEQQLHRQGVHTVVLDGDVVRTGLSSDLGFSEADRVENIRRVAHVGKLMLDAGLVVINAFISPLKTDRDLARATASPHPFVEVFVDAPLHVAETRDPKGLYRRARQGQLTNFTGIDAPYERPEQPDVHVCTDSLTVEQSVVLILRALINHRVIQSGDVQ